MALVLAAAPGCTGAHPANDGGGSDDAAMDDMAAPPDDAAGDGGAPGAGTCASPVRLSVAGERMGASTVYRGSTEGAPDMLHPYGGCVTRDASEIVVSYTVPAGVQAVKVTTEGSAFDTALYVRTNCSQAMGGMDLGCNNDAYTAAGTSPQSTLFLTNVLAGQVLFIVVDGNAGEGATGGASGAFTLTVTEVPFGSQGNPCRLAADPAADGGAASPRCDAPLRCSEGGGADGTALCVPTVATGAACDARGYTNTCLEGARCVSDPTPAGATGDGPVCALPGTHAGAPCRASEPRCDAPLACGAGDAPVCVRVLPMGVECDPTGTANRCATDTVCSPLGDGGPAICHAP